MSASMPLSMRARASARATAIARSMEPSQRGLPGSGGRCTMPIRRMTARNCSTRGVDSPRSRRYHGATISRSERSHPVGYQTLIFERAGAVATITLNRPDARNALDFVMRGELAAVLDEIADDEAARAVILTGA